MPNKATCYFKRSSNKRNWSVFDPENKTINDQHGTRNHNVEATDFLPLKSIYKASVTLSPDSDRLYPQKWPTSAAELDKPTKEEIKELVNNFEINLPDNAL